MDPVRRMYLDTNIFLHLAEGEDGALRNLLLDLIVSQKKAENPFLCTSELSLAELLVHPHRDNNIQLAKIYENWIFHGNTWLDVGPVARDVLVHAALVRSQYTSVKLPDAIHLSTAVGFECSHFLTTDKKLPRSIRLTNKLSGYSRMSPELAILHPTQENLQAIASQRP